MKVRAAAIVASCAVVASSGYTANTTSRDHAQDLTACVAQTDRNDEVPRQVDTSFSAAVPRNKMILWMNGEPVPGPVLNVRFKSDVLFINGISLDLKTHPYEVPTEQLSIYEDLPFVKALTETDVPLADAVRSYFTVREELIQEARTVYREHGLEAALALLRQSPLISEVSNVESSVRIHYRGSEVEVRLDLGATPQTPATVSPASRAKRMAHKLRVWADAAEYQPMIIFISKNGSFTILGGPESEKANEQARYLRGGGDPLNLPDGPLSMKDAVLKDIVTTRESN